MKYKHDICIVGGCGHVGLPLGIAFANKNLSVILYDKNQEAVNKINKKIMPFLEQGAQEILPQVIESKKLLATTNPSVISNAENIILVIGTPVDEHLNPRLTDVMQTIEEILEYLNNDQLLVLRSTLYPGVTDKVHDYLRSKKKSTLVAFCPERVAEGHALNEISTLPQIVSGTEKGTVIRVKKLFSILCNDIVELSTIEAELAKLFTNTWRYINFAISNQFYMIANSCGVDFTKIYQAMTENYPRLQGFAKAGFAAGPCLFKDTMQLSAFSSNNFFMGHAAMLVNEGLPNYLVDQLKRKFSLNEKTIGILGMAFKANSDDSRESLSYKLKKILQIEAKQVLCSDVYIKDKSFVKPKELLRRSDIIILGVPHKEYKSLDMKNKPNIDIWNFFSQGTKTP